MCAFSHVIGWSCVKYFKQKCDNIFELELWNLNYNLKKNTIAPGIGGSSHTHGGTFQRRSYILVLKPECTCIPFKEEKIIQIFKNYYSECRMAFVLFWTTIRCVGFYSDSCFFKKYPLLHSCGLPVPLQCDWMMHSLQCTY